ncbi:MAG: hypothetical protein APR54_12130 [Candidatus Cloacimonas sp. SDB]|nr:MAG: hypothetical protein APR54_12130 [Candidatus Cloacimonas sp. SDB]
MGLQEMDTDELIKQFREQKDTSTDRYLTGILDYFKWITTFDFALIIWIGANAKNEVYTQNFWMFLSIGFIILSIIIAIITTHFILDIWNKDRELKFHIFKLAVDYQVNEKYPTITGQQELEKQRKIVAETGLSIFVLKKFDGHLILHIGALLVGIIFYLFAVFL